MRIRSVRDNFPSWYHTFGTAGRRLRVRVCYYPWIYGVWRYCDGRWQCGDNAREDKFATVHIEIILCTG